MLAALTLAAMPLAWVGCNTQPQQFAALTKKVSQLEKQLAAVQDQLAATEKQLALLKTSAPPVVAGAAKTKETTKEKTPEPASAARKTETAAPANGSKPVISVASAVHDFGATWVGPPLEHAFTITNTGNATLQITKVKPSCGCTVAGDYPKKLAPGASGKFPFSLKSQRLHGAYAKNITITSNDPDTPQLKLTLKGEVKWEVAVKPTMASFGTITDQTKSHERVVTLTNNTKRPLKVKLRTPSAKDPFKYELRETKPEKEFELHVTLEPQAEGGTKRSTVVLDTNFDKQKEIKVVVHARVPERLDVQPPYLTVVVPVGRPATGTKPRTRQVRFNNHGETPVKVIEATVDDPEIKTNVKTNQPGKSYTIFVEMPANYKPPKTGRTLTLKTDDAQKPEIKVPIRLYERTRPSAKRNQRPAESMRGKPTPAFSATTKGGKTVSVAALKDTVTVLNFFAPNCGYCKRQLPIVEKVRAQYAGKKNVRFVNISQTMRTKFTDEQVMAKLKEYGTHSEVVINSDNSLGRLFKATSYPTMFVVGKDGKIAHVNVGAKKNLDKLLKRQLDGLLNGKPAAKKTEGGKPAAAKPPAQSGRRRTAATVSPVLPTPVTVTPP